MSASQATPETFHGFGQQVDEIGSGFVVLQSARKQTCEPGPEVDRETAFWRSSLTLAVDSTIPPVGLAHANFQELAMPEAEMFR